MAYNEEDIKVLNWSEHIRLRPAMYLGNTSHFGVWNMIEGVLDDIINKRNEEISIEIKLDHDKVSLHFTLKQTEQIFQYASSSELHVHFVLGAKDIDTLFYSILLYINKETKIEIGYNDKTVTIESKKGKIKDCIISDNRKKSNYINIDFTLDETIFNNTVPNFDEICDKIQMFAYTSSHCKFIVRDKPSKQNRIFHYKNGLKSLFEKLIVNNNYLLFNRSFFPLLIKKEIGDYHYELCIAIINRNHLIRNITFNNHRYVYLSHEYDYYKGSLEDGINDGAFKAIKHWCKTNNEQIYIWRNKKDFLAHHLFMVAGVKGDNFSFAGSTKELLSMPEVKKNASKLVYDEVLKLLNEDLYKTKNILQDLNIICKK